MRTGTYKTSDGELVHVTRTAGGTFIVRYQDGHVAVVK